MSEIVTELNTPPTSGLCPWMPKYGLTYKEIAPISDAIHHEVSTAYTTEDMVDATIIGLDIIANAYTNDKLNIYRNLTRRAHKIHEASEEIVNLVATNNTIPSYDSEIPGFSQYFEDEVLLIQIIANLKKTKRNGHQILAGVSKAMSSNFRMLRQFSVLEFTHLVDMNSIDLTLGLIKRLVYSVSYKDHPITEELKIILENHDLRNVEGTRRALTYIRGKQEKGLVASIVLPTEGESQAYVCCVLPDWILE